jgi:hypothetical protein
MRWFVSKNEQGAKIKLIGVYRHLVDCNSLQGYSIKQHGRHNYITRKPRLRDIAETELINAISEEESIQRIAIREALHSIESLTRERNMYRRRYGPLSEEK